jgi:hypothetical protein
MFLADKLNKGGSLGGYQISRSLRFNSADSAYLNRTPASAGNRTTWTWSGWIKFSKITGIQFIFGASSDNYANNFTLLQMDNAASTLTFYDYTSAYNFQLTPSMVFRDPSAWYHIVWAYDSNAATSSDRVKIYVNGNQVTAFSTASYPTSAKATVLNSAVVHNYGTSSYPISGYLTETNFIDGQALTPSSFGETNAQTGVWQPKAYSGSYGTNGFYLNFSDNSNTTAATLGKDYSGNGNNWTPNNFSVTAGVGNDSLVDSPTAYGTDTGVGGEVRGNYCTWNPLKTTKAPTNGNLDFVGASNSYVDTVYGTFGLSRSGKYYYEVTGAYTVGFNKSDVNPTIDQLTGRIVYNGGSGIIFNEGTALQSGLATITSSDVVGVAINLDSGTLAFYKNNVQLGTNVSISTSDTWWPYLQNIINYQGYTNFGQRPFAYTAPSGFKALCTQNLPTPTIGATTATQASQFFAPVIYSGDGTTGRSIAVGFQPDFTWIKTRDPADWHVLDDSVRGAGKILASNSTQAEATDTTAFNAFNSNGFVVGTSAGWHTNRTGGTYASWNWKANGSGSTNTSGSITSTVSANTTSGFSIATFTKSGTTNQTIGHGLGVAPSMIIVKAIQSAGYNSWAVWHTSIGIGNYLELNTTAASQASSTIWNNTLPTSTVFSMGTAWTSTVSTLAYCFAEVAGYSKFGSYTGNGSADGPFLFTGFKPAFVLIKSSNFSASWRLWDAKRNTYNVVNSALFPNLSNAEVSTADYAIDFLSNGIKIRSADDGENQSGSTFIYAAFAETPLKFSLAR